MTGGSQLGSGLTHRGRQQTAHIDCPRCRDKSRQQGCLLPTRSLSMRAILLSYLKANSGLALLVPVMQTQRKLQGIVDSRVYVVASPLPHLPTFNDPNHKRSDTITSLA